MLIDKKEVGCQIEVDLLAFQQWWWCHLDIRVVLDNERIVGKRITGTQNVFGSVAIGRRFFMENA